MIKLTLITAIVWYFVGPVVKAAAALIRLWWIGRRAAAPTNQKPAL